MEQGDWTCDVGWYVSLSIRDSTTYGKNGIGKAGFVYNTVCAFILCAVE